MGKHRFEPLTATLVGAAPPFYWSFRAKIDWTPMGLYHPIFVRLSCKKIPKQTLRYTRKSDLPKEAFHGGWKGWNAPNQPRAWRKTTSARFLAWRKKRPQSLHLIFVWLSPCPHELKSGMRFVGLGLGRYAVWKRWLAGILEMAVEKS